MNRSSENQIPKLAVWFFPSIKDILFLGFLLSPLLIEVSTVLYDTDTGWHIRNGEHILLTRNLPRSDYFSYTAYGKPWYSWEWLSDVILAIVHKYAGLNGVVFWANLTFASIFTLLFRWTVKRGGNVLVCALFSGLAGTAASVHWLARPHLFTLLLLLFWYFILDKVQEGETTKWLWCLPLMILVWTNLHGGFVIGLILLLIFAFGNYLTSLTSNDAEVGSNARHLSKRFGTMTVLCLLVTLVNPYGWGLHKHIFDAYVESSQLLDNVSEFRSPSFHVTVVKFFELLLLLGITIVGISRRSLSFIELGLLAFWTHMALFSVRHIPLYSVIIVPIFIRRLTDYFSSTESDPNVLPWVRRLTANFNNYSQNILRFDKQFQSYLYPVSVTVFMVALCLNQGYLGNVRVLNKGFDPKQFPVKAAEFIEANRMEGNLFTTDQWSGYLIYRFHPRYPVFFDGRSDMYGEDLIKEYLSLITLEHNWKSLLEKYKIAWVLLPVGSPLSSALKELNTWLVIYDDHCAIIFVKKTVP